MARQSRPDPQAVPDGTTSEILDAKGRALAVHAQHSSAVANTFGDGVPYDRERLVGQARFFMSTSAEAMLNAGQCLIQLKENEPHGDFIEIVETRLGISRRTAQVMMQAAARYLAPALQAKAQAPALLGLGKTKLIELLVEPDEAIEALADGGTVAGMSLDDIQTMTSRELRAALLEERQKAAAKDKVIAKKDAKLNKLAEAEEIRRHGAPNEREKQQINDLRDAGVEAELALQRLLAAASEAMSNPATEAAELQARQTVEFVAQRLADLCADHGIGVDILGERVEPGWRREIADMAAEGMARTKRRA